MIILAYDCKNHRIQLSSMRKPEHYQERSQCVWHPAYLRCQPQYADELAQKKTSTIQNLKRHCCQPNRRIFWKSTKCGRLCWNTGRNAGFGQRCVVAHAKSLLMPSAIEAKRLVNFSGSGSLPVIKVVKVSVICGMLINWSSHLIHTSASEKVKGKLIIWNVGITG